MTERPETIEAVARGIDAQARRALDQWLDEAMR